MTYQWFIDRIGKRVYRKGGNCKCEHCKKVLREGLIISPLIGSRATHADYLYSCQNEMRLTYSDKPFRRQK